MLNNYKCRLYETWRQEKDTFLFAFSISIIIGIIAHSFFFLNRQINVDYLGEAVNTTSQLSLGRFLPIFLIKMTAPVLGVVIIIGLSLSVAILSLLFRINDKLRIVAISLGIITFPVLPYSFVYFFNVERVALAIVFAVLSVYIAIQFKWSFLLGGLFLALSIAEYQSYLGLAMVLALLYLMFLLSSGENTKKIFSVLLSFSGMGISGLTIYFILLKINLKLAHISLESYRGVSTISFSVKKILYGLFKAYNNFINYVRGEKYFAGNYVTILLWTLIILTLLYLTVELIKKKEYIRAILFVGCFGLLPIATNIIDVIEPTYDTDSRQIYQMIFVMISPLFLMTAFKIPSKSHKILRHGLIAVFIVMGLNNYYYSNTYYNKVMIYTEQTDHLLNRVWSRIEETESYEKNKEIPILTLNDMKPLYGKSPQILKDDIMYNDGFVDRFITFNQYDSIIGSGKFGNLVLNRLGIVVNAATYEQMEKVFESEEYLKMGVWPSKDSIKEIEGVLVVNFSPVLQVSEEDKEQEIKIIAQTQDKSHKFAFYLYEDGQVVLSQWYSDINNFVIPKHQLSEDKNYLVEVFCQNSNQEFIRQKYYTIKSLGKNVH